MSRNSSPPIKTYKLRGRHGKNEGASTTLSRTEGSLMKTYKLKGKRGKNAKEKLAEAAMSGHTEATESKLNEEEVIVNGDEKEKVKPGTPTVVKQKKRKMGADAEIAQSYMSSAKKESPPRFRPRKPVPVFRMVDLGDRDDNKVVGRRVKVYWSESRRWFVGRIKSFDRRKKLHNVVYDDGDKEDLELRKERFELEILPHEDFNIVRFEPKRRVAAEVKRIKGSDSEEEDNIVSTDDSSGADDESLEAESGDGEEELKKT